MTRTITIPDRWTGIEIRHLAAFEAVVDTGSFAAAGRLLGYSQPAISQQIAVLERVVGVRLLDRPGGRHRVTVTEAGERLLRHGRRAAAAIRAAEADVRALVEGEAGTLRVGTFQSAAVRLLPEVMRRWLEQMPQIDVRLSEQDYDDPLLEQLRSGELDLAFAQRTREPDLEHDAVLTDPYVLLAQAASAAALEGRQLRPRDVAALPLVAYRRPSGGEALLLERRLEPDVVFRSDEGGVVQGLVGAGVGYALVPLLTVDLDDVDIAVLDVHGLPPREITLARLTDRTLGPAASAFVEVVQDVAHDLRSHGAYARRRQASPGAER